MIKKENISTLEEIKSILDSVKPTELYIESLHEENNTEYENLCEEVEFQLAEIEKSLIGKEKYTIDNICRVDIRMSLYWEYIRNKLSFDELLKKLKENSDGLLLK